MSDINGAVRVYIIWGVFLAILVSDVFGLVMVVRNRHTMSLPRLTLNLLAALTIGAGLIFLALPLFVFGAQVLMGF